MTTLPIKMKRSEVMDRIVTTSNPAEHGMDRARAEVLIDALVGVGLLEIEPEPQDVAPLKGFGMKLIRWPGPGDYGRGGRYEIITDGDEPRVVWSTAPKDGPL